MRARSLALLGSLTLAAACGRPAVSLSDGSPAAGDTLGQERTVRDLGMDRRRTDGGPGLDRRVDAGPLPDLVFADFSATVNGTTVTYSMKVCNNGTADAPGFTVDLYYNGAAAPKAKQTGDQTQGQKPLARGACAPITLQRTAAPNGTFKSWAQLDAAQAIPELDKSNNVAGPINVVVNQPPAPDLTFKLFDAKLVGTDIVYDVTVCNIGTAAAILFRVDINYSRALPPGPLQVGDVSHYVLFLAPGGCESFSVTYKGPPVGLYNSWAFADTLNTVKELDETNNTAGPKLIVVAPPADCVVECIFATGCGVFTVTEYPQCLTWCNLLKPAEKSCLVAAQQASSCTDLKQCKLPPPPPPPAPPWDCLPLCNYVVNTCKLLPQNALVTCVAGCLTLPQTKLQCGVDAMNKKQCLQVALCIL